ncbi:MAG: hypothetical protein ABMA26_16180 [Limisphaerales bacterium]
MSDTLISASPSRDMLGVRAWMDGQIAALVDQSERILDYTRRELLRKEPTSELLAEHKRASRLIIGLLRMVICQLEDPDYPQPAAARQLGSRHRQLQEFHDTLHNPMPASELEQFTREHFAQDATARRLFPEAFAK